jgi:trehalose-6-phosphate synthase
VLNRVGAARASLRGATTVISGNISTSQSSNSLRTLVDSEAHNANVIPHFDKPIVISSIDSFTPLSGFKTKLRGYQKFLQSYPNYRNKTVLIQFIPSVYCNSDISKQNEAQPGDNQNYLTDSISIFKDLSNEIKSIAEEIHKEFGPQCLMLIQGNPPLARRLALWSHTQILLIATLKDGLCLPPLEFVTVKKILNDF